MYVMPVSINSVVSAAAAAASSYAYSDVLDLSAPWFNRKSLTLNINISGGSVSGELSIVLAGAALSGCTFTPFVTGSGTSVLLASGTSIGGTGGVSGAWMLPLTVVLCSGVTERLTGLPYLRIGCLAMKNDIDVKMFLIAG